MRFLLVLALLVPSAGCSAYLAARGGDDLGVVYAGASRDQVGREFGKARSEERTRDGVRAVYKVRLAEPDLRRAALHAVRTPAAVGSGALLGSVIVGEGFGNSSEGAKIGAYAAIPVVVAYEAIAITRELGRRSIHRFEVTYDASGAVVSSRFVDPEAVQRDALERSWATAKAQR